MESIIQFLRDHPLFTGLSSEALQEVAKKIAVRKMERHEQILLEGERQRYGYIIVRGQVRIYRIAPNGREQALMDLFPSQTFNLVPIIDGGPAPSGAVARTNGLLYGISREAFAHLRQAYPSIGEALLVNFAGRLRYLTMLVEELSLRTVPQRLAHLLLRMADEEHPQPYRFTQQELASRLGTVREVISRTMRSFEKQGLIAMERHQIVIRDRSRLRAIAYQDESEDSD